ncbi:MAG TPA: tRNA (adenosine(37)-N6)-threonylcarbamoyltransferase complex ATPase subunit type 1 TsaE [bacterium]
MTEKRGNTGGTGTAVTETTASPEDTETFGARLGRLLRPGDVVALEGELGSGKTTLVRGIARGLGLNPDAVRSPTFVLLREYPGEVPVVHVDGYRLEHAPDAAWLDLDLVFAPEKITLIEWAQRFEGLLPGEHVNIKLEHVSANRRRLSVELSGARAEALREALRASGPVVSPEPEADPA